MEASRTMTYDDEETKPSTPVQVEAEDAYDKVNAGIVDGYDLEPEQGESKKIILLWLSLASNGQLDIMWSNVRGPITRPQLVQVEIVV
jgi:hypothetical protein